MTAFLLHLLRHGAPELPGRMLGQSDPAATAAGVAACLEQVSDLDIDAVVSSDLRRARAVAEAVAESHALPLTLDTRWRELDFGGWEGLAAAEIPPEPLGAFWNDPDAHPPPGGERWSALARRVGDAIAALPPRPTLVVTHGGAMRAALALLCGFEQRQLWAFDFPYAALLTLKLWPGPQPGAQIVGLWP